LLGVLGEDRLQRIFNFLLVVFVSWLRFVPILEDEALSEGVRIGHRLSDELLRTYLV
jgi:hypothetical protein